MACAPAFLGEGVDVTLVARDATRLEAVRRELVDAFPTSRAHAIAADLTRADAAAAAVAQAQQALGPIDVLVNSADAARRTAPEELTPRHWHDGMDAKYFTYIHVLDPVVKAMAARGQGAILNIVGMGGKLVTPTHLPGGAANAALMLASVGLAAAYGGQGVRVNVIDPGITRTDRIEEGLAVEARRTGTSTQQVLARVGERLPLGRPAGPEEIADAAVFFCSPRAGLHHGRRRVDGRGRDADGRPRPAREAARSARRVSCPGRAGPA